VNSPARSRESQATTATPAKPVPCDRPACSQMRVAQLAGNFAVQRLVQASLRVGHPADPQEHEAERVASAVSCGGCNEAVPCGECAEKKKIRRSAKGSPPASAPSVPQSRIARLGSGAPLDTALRMRMQQHLGYDLSRVRVHTGSLAAQTARGIDARAFTAGHDVVFDQGEFRPGTAEGDRLLAHELTHVVQNGGEAATIRRLVSGDVRTQSITDTWARALTDDELSDQVGIVRGELTIHPDASAEYESALANLQVLEAEVRRRGQPAAEEVPSIPAQVPVNLQFEFVGMQGGDGAVAGQPSPTVMAGLTDYFGSGGAGMPMLAMAGFGGFGGGGPAAAANLIEGYDAEDFLGGASSAGGYGILRFVDPIPGGASPLRLLNPFANGPAGAGPNMFTRFAGPETMAELATPPRWRLTSDLRPRWGTAAPEEIIHAESLFRQHGVTPRQLMDLRAALRARGIAGLTAQESALFRTVTMVHADIAGATPSSPLLSLTRLEPRQALEVFSRRGTVMQRAYIVRVRIDPGSVADVNQLLNRVGTGSHLAAELEVVVAEELSTTGRGGARVLSVTRNPTPGAPLGGWRGAGLQWVGRGLIVLGAGIAIHEVVTAQGPHRRQQQGTAFGSFAGGTLAGAFGAGFCVGAGIATGGVALLLCAGAFGLAGAGAGGLLGGGLGSLFD
jgi:hypothetical protein